MIVWLAYIFAPIFIGVCTFFVMKVNVKPKANALTEAAGTLVLLVFLIGGLSFFREVYGRVVFVEFVAGCVVSMLVQWFVHSYRRY